MNKKGKFKFELFVLIYKISGLIIEVVFKGGFYIVLYKKINIEYWIISHMILINNCALI